MFFSQGCFAMVPSMGEVLGLLKQIREFQSSTGNLNTGSVEAKEAAEHPAMHRTAFHNQDCSSPKCQ